MDSRTIENGRYRVSVAGDGTLTVLDRSSGVSVAGLNRLEDVADRGDSYTFCPLDGDRPRAPSGARVEVTAAGPVYAELEISYELRLPAALAAGRRGRSAGTVACPAASRVRLAAGADRVEIATVVENRASDHRLRVCFPCPERYERVRAEGHFAVVRRHPRPVWDGSWFEPPHETNHTLGAVAAGGLVVLGKGLPEYEATEAGDLALTLLRCVGWLSRHDLSTRRGGAGPRLEVPGAQCHGRHVFEYAVALGDPPDADLVRRSQDYRFEFAEGAPGAELTSPLPELGGELVFSALKAAEDGDGVVLRVFAAGEGATAPRLPSGSERCRLDEAPAGEEAPLGPGEIGSYRLRAPARPQGRP